jgi:hypothetical protein
MANGSNQPERPRAEPEILPPDRSGGQPQDDQSPWRPYETWARGNHRIYVTRLGPFTSIIMMLVFAALVAIIFLAILSAALIWLPLIILVVIVGAIYRYLLR